MSFTDDLISKYAQVAETIYDARIAGDNTWVGLLAEFTRELGTEAGPQQYHVVCGDDYVWTYDDQYDSWVCVGATEHLGPDSTSKWDWNTMSGKASYFKGFEAGLDKLAKSWGGIKS